MEYGKISIHDAATKEPIHKSHYFENWTTLIKIYVSDSLRRTGSKEPFILESDYTDRVVAVYWVSSEYFITVTRSHQWKNVWKPIADLNRENVPETGISCAVLFGEVSDVEITHISYTLADLKNVLHQLSSWNLVHTFKIFTDGETYCTNVQSSLTYGVCYSFFLNSSFASLLNKDQYVQWRALRACSL